MNSRCTLKERGVSLTNKIQHFYTEINKFKEALKSSTTTDKYIEISNYLFKTTQKDDLKLLKRKV